MEPITREQRQALFTIYNRDWDKPGSYLAFRRTAVHYAHMAVVMVPWCNMFLGIESDGYTHS